MARGWESKDVESQRDALEQRLRERQTIRLTKEQLAIREKREMLQMDRVRVQRDLAAARHPRHKEMLHQALAHLDRKLAELPDDPLS
jgi:hypothetical protein